MREVAVDTERGKKALEDHETLRQYLNEVNRKHGVSYVDARDKFSPYDYDILLGDEIIGIAEGKIGQQTGKSNLGVDFVRRRGYFLQAAKYDKCCDIARRNRIVFKLYLWLKYDGAVISWLLVDSLGFERTQIERKKLPKWSTVNAGRCDTVEDMVILNIEGAQIRHVSLQDRADLSHTHR